MSTVLRVSLSACVQFSFFFYGKVIIHGFIMYKVKHYGFGSLRCHFIVFRQKPKVQTKQSLQSTSFYAFIIPAFSFQKDFFSVFIINVSP